MKIKVLIIVLLFVLGLLLCGCSGGKGRGASSGGSMASGSSDSTESDDAGFIPTFDQPKNAELAMKVGEFSDKFQSSMGMGMGMDFMEVETEGMLGNIGNATATVDKIVERFYAGDKLIGTTIVIVNNEGSIEAHFSINGSPSFDTEAGKAVAIEPNKGIRIPIESANCNFGIEARAERKVVIIVERDDSICAKFVVPVEMRSRESSPDRSMTN